MSRIMTPIRNCLRRNHQPPSLAKFLPVEKLLEKTFAASLSAATDCFWTFGRPVEVAIEINGDRMIYRQAGLLHSGNSSWLFALGRNHSHRSQISCDLLALPFRLEANQWWEIKKNNQLARSLIIGLKNGLLTFPDNPAADRVQKRLDSKITGYANGRIAGEEKIRTYGFGHYLPTVEKIIVYDPRLAAMLPGIIKEALAVA